MKTIFTIIDNELPKDENTLFTGDFAAFVKWSHWQVAVDPPVAKQKEIVEEFCVLYDGDLSFKVDGLPQEQEQPLTFAIGDVVQYKGVEKIVTDSSTGTGMVKYALNGCAWYDRKDITLIRRADAASMKKLAKFMQEEE